MGEYIDENKLKTLGANMRKVVIYTIINLLLIMICGNLYSQQQAKIIYIANEGFLIEVDKKKILVDGLFDTIKGTWCDSPTENMVKKMEKSLPPFDNIDIIAITHSHRDHFNERIVVNHLLNNPKSILLCPEEVKKILSKNPNYKKIKKNIVSITPDSYKSEKKNISDIDVKVLRLEHSHYMIKDKNTGKKVNKHRNVENIGFLFNINGYKVFHCGDTNPMNEKEYRGFALYKENIDLAFLERMFLSRGENSFKWIDKNINPKSIIFMHIGPEEKKAVIEMSKNQKNIKTFNLKMDFATYQKNK